MKIVHIMELSPFSDNLTYQDNLLTKYHKKLDCDVTIITSNWTRDKNKIVKTDKKNYINDDGVKIIRLPIKNNKTFFYKFKRLNGLYGAIESERPDILFIHGCQFLDIDIIVKYLKKYPTVKVYVDNHSDFSNSAKNILSKYILHKIIWKSMAKKICPYTTKFYGVLPARVDFLIDVYKLPKAKCELLVMGADDELVNNKNMNDIRSKYNIEKDDFLIVTGGKIDLNKKETLEFMKAVKKFNNKKVKLLIFGSVIDKLKEEFESLCYGNIIYIGWLNALESYEAFSSANLIVFPGNHSVYWEQAVALGRPIVCKHITGTTHIDIGGNIVYFYKNNEEEYINILTKIINDKSFYNNMKENANKEEKNNFLYSYIAKKSIEIE